MSDETEILTQEPETEQETPDETQETTETASDEDSVDAAQERSHTAKFTPEQQRELGKLLSQERKRIKAQLQSERQPAAENAQPAVAQGQIYDHKTGMTFDLNSVMGQQVQYQQLVAQKEAEQRQAQEHLSKQAQYEELKEKLNDAELDMPELGAARATVASYASDAMCDALAGLDDPAKVVAFLGDKKGELQRIQRLSPAKQMHEIFTLAQRLTPAKKMVSSAPAPVSKIKSSGGLAKGPSREEMNADQRRDYYEKLFNTR